MKKRNDDAMIISKLFKVTPSYVRLIMKDTKRAKYKSAKADAIREKYKHYTSGKKSLIKEIKQKAA